MAASHRFERRPRVVVNVCLFAATEHAFPPAAEAPAASEARSEKLPPAGAFDGERDSVAEWAAIAVGDHGNEQLRRHPDNDDAYEHEDPDEERCIGPRLRADHGACSTKLEARFHAGPQFDERDSAFDAIDDDFCVIADG